MKSKRAGYTLLEALIAVVLLTTIMGGSILAMRTGQRSFQQTMTRGRVNSKANRTLNKIASALGSARASTLSISPGLDRITFQSLEGSNAGVLTWSTDTEIRLEYETGEVDNGLDDDGDGFIDECQAIQILNVGDADEQRIVLTKSVREFLEGEEPDGADDNGNGLDDERGLCFELQGDAIVIRLTVQKNHPEWGTAMQTLTTVVGLRN